MRLAGAVLRVGLGGLVLILASEQEARAYADPGSGALVWQTLAAGLVGLLFYLRKFGSWMKGRKKGDGA